MSGEAALFEQYVSESEIHVNREFQTQVWKKRSEPLLNGEPYKFFRDSVALSARREKGTFFTGENYASRTAEALRSQLNNRSTVMDPTCGMGDLLIAYASGLSIQQNLHETLMSWGELLFGSDSNSSLVRMTKVRLTLFARYRGRFTDAIDDASQYFPNIIHSRMEDAEFLVSRANGFLFNPPFGMKPSPKECEWGSGSTNSAAIFLSKLISLKSADSPIAAILPDVLRAGSRYAKFRQQIIEQGYSGSHIPLGRFDSWTDVDVFLSLISRSERGELWTTAVAKASDFKIGDFFDVSVGAVVPHRHQKSGPWRKYICAKTTPRWSSSFEPNASRRFKGTTVEPPFVVIRRTSSPSDKIRAVGSIVVGSTAVAVENHLVVLKPCDGSLNTCVRALEVLRAESTNSFLNDAIRCRHLTTRVVNEIPWVNV